MCINNSLFLNKEPLKYKVNKVDCVPSFWQLLILLILFDLGGG